MILDQTFVGFQYRYSHKRLRNVYLCIKSDSLQKVIQRPSMFSPTNTYNCRVSVILYRNSSLFWDVTTMVVVH